MIFNVILKDLVKQNVVELFFFSVYLLGSGSASGSGSIWTFLGSWIRNRMKTYADPKNCSAPLAPIRIISQSHGHGVRVVINSRKDLQQTKKWTRVQLSFWSLPVCRKTKGSVIPTQLKAGLQFSLFEWWGGWGGDWWWLWHTGTGLKRFTRQLILD